MEPQKIEELLQKLVDTVVRLEEHVDTWIRGEALPNKIRVVRARAKYIPDVQALYNEYPRKLGKQRGFTKLLKDIKSEDEFYACGQAILNLKRIVEREHRADEHIPYFSTFANHWRDYIPEETFVKEHKTIELPSSEMMLL